jgi:hypothetical protein
MPKQTRSSALAVFINCPFDPSYRRVFDAIVFTVVALGCQARCARERETGTQERLKKILEIIDACHFGIHDISFMGIDPKTKLARHNMALELGVFLGCCEFGGQRHARKSCLILDRDPWRYRKSISDLSGRDIKSHNGNPKQAITVVRDWFVTESKSHDKPAGSVIVQQYRRFRKQLPSLCRKTDRRASELLFNEYCVLATTWLQTNA